MNTKRKFFSDHTQRGNAMIYVLVIVALFGALTFVLSRQSSTSEANIISDEQAEIYAGMILQSSMGLKQSIEQMLWSGSTIGFTSAGTELDFTTPDSGTFNNPPVIHKVFHPSGGGMILPRLPDDAINQVTTPAARWYIGRVNNVDWTETTADDVILTAYQIKEKVCERINERLTDSIDIPVLTVPAPQVLIYSSAADFTSAHCQDADSPPNDNDCDGQPALCVKDSNGAWSFFSLMAAE